MKLSTGFLCMIMLLAMSVQADTNRPPKTGMISGKITDKQDGTPLKGATVNLVDKLGGAVTNENGQFLINNLEPGNFSLRISFLGYEPLQVESLLVTAGGSAIVNLGMAKKPFNLKTITVTPGRFNISGSGATSSQTLTRRELETMPQMGEDVFRAVTRLPGVASNDFSSRFIVRGGEHDEVLVTLDGLQIYEPFHIKDIMGGLFSAVDVLAIGGVELLTGGYTAKYGDRTSGVFNIKTHRPSTDLKKVSAGISFMNAHFMTEGAFSDNRGSWLLSGRRGYVDFLLKVAGEDENLKPTYYDLLGKLQYQLSPQFIFSANFLHAGDRFRAIYEDDYDADTIISSYDNSYLWLSLRSQLHDCLVGTTLLSIGQVKHNRYGFAFWQSYQVPNFRIDDKGSFTIVGFKSDWDLEISDNYILGAGVDLRNLKSEYDYSLTRWIYGYDNGHAYYRGVDIIQHTLEPSGNQLGLYITNRFRIIDPLTVEVGGRYDKHSYTGDEQYSPRINLACNFGNQTSLRAGWGYYYQAQRIDELSPGDRITAFQSAERAEHRTIGLEHLYESAVKFRIEAYQKRYSNLRPDIRNIYEALRYFPEGSNDRTSHYRGGSISSGLEVFMKREPGNKFTWMLSYALAKVEDDVDSIRVTSSREPDGIVKPLSGIFPNTYDQRHTLYLDLSYRPNLKWQYNIALSMHSGWPYTAKVLRSERTLYGRIRYWTETGELMAERFPVYSRIDIRINRNVEIWGGRMSAYLEVINVLDRENVGGHEYEIQYDAGTPYLKNITREGFGLLPILGLNYSIEI